MALRPTCSLVEKKRTLLYLAEFEALSVRFEVPPAQWRRAAACRALPRCTRAERRGASPRAQTHPRDSARPCPPASTASPAPALQRFSSLAALQHLLPSRGVAVSWGGKSFLRDRPLLDTSLLRRRRHLLCPGGRLDLRASTLTRRAPAHASPPTPPPPTVFPVLSPPPPPRLSPGPAPPPPLPTPPTPPRAVFVRRNREIVALRPTWGAPRRRSTSSS